MGCASMNLLAINCGSSSLKFRLVETEDEVPARQDRQVAHGVVDRIGDLAVAHFESCSGERLESTADVTDHGDAARLVLTWLRSQAVVGNHGIDAVGHRVVHGGDLFAEPTLVDERLLDAIDAISDLAPLHNKPALEAILACRAFLGGSVPMVAVFDTAFHRTQPDWASYYAIPKDLAIKHRIRRYGFHGLAHQFMSERYAELTGSPLAETRLITLQLGNGCSATAVAGGRSVDTSMGFTPLEGLIMGTRSGNVDPSLANYLARCEGVDIAVVEDWLNTRSGLLGISGKSRDMRELLEAERLGDKDASLAIEMFCYSVRKYVGAYLNVLGGADAVVFSGGIGENAPSVRARICDGMVWCGLVLDEARNAAVIGSEDRISASVARIRAYVIPVDEEAIITSETATLLGRLRLA